MLTKLNPSHGRLGEDRGKDWEDDELDSTVFLFKSFLPPPPRLGRGENRERTERDRGRSGPLLTSLSWFREASVNFLKTNGVECRLAVRKRQRERERERGDSRSSSSRVRKERGEGKQSSRARP